MKRLIFLFLLVGLLSACAPSVARPQQIPDQSFVTATLPSTPLPMPTSSNAYVTPTPTTNPSVLAQLFPGSDNELTRTDEQRMVVITITPLNLDKMPDETLVFDVSMNTHSVDLSMDLAALSTLTTDTGIQIQPSLWDAPLGGHHVSGQLIFPAYKDGVYIFDGATTFSIQVQNVDADLRVFEWPVQ